MTFRRGSLIRLRALPVVAAVVMTPIFILSFMIPVAVIQYRAERFNGFWQDGTTSAEQLTPSFNTAEQRAWWYKSLERPAESRLVDMVRDAVESRSASAVARVTLPVAIMLGASFGGAALAWGALRWRSRPRYWLDVGSRDSFRPWVTRTVCKSSLTALLILPLAGLILGIGRTCGTLITGWPGLTVNMSMTEFFVGVAVAMVVSFRTFGRAWPEYVEGEIGAAEQRCVNCDYVVGSLPTAVCPECGTEVTRLKLPPVVLPIGMRGVIGRRVIAVVALAGGVLAATAIWQPMNIRDRVFAWRTGQKYAAAIEYSRVRVRLDECVRLNLGTGDVLLMISRSVKRGSSGEELSFGGVLVAPLGVDGVFDHGTAAAEMFQLIPPGTVLGFETVWLGNHQCIYAADDRLPSPSPFVEVFIPSSAEVSGVTRGDGAAELCGLLSQRLGTLMREYAEAEEDIP